MTLSFRTTLTLLIWGAALVPAFFLTIRHFEDSYNKQYEINKQKLISDTVVAIDASREGLKQSINMLDEMAIDGSIIASASMDIMSVRALAKMESFLANYPMFSSIMIIAPDLFQTEVIPTKSLEMNLAPFTDFLVEIFLSSKSIADPQARYFAVPRKDVVPNSENDDSYLLAIARPILKPKESLTQPFEVISILFVMAPMPEIVEQMVRHAEISMDDVLLELSLNQQIVYSNMPKQLAKNMFIYRDKIAFGDNLPFKLKIAFAKKVELSIAELIFQRDGLFLYTAGLMVLILAIALFLTRRLVRPVFELKKMTEQLGSSNFLDYKAEKAFGRSYFREFNEVHLLLRNMSKTIGEQFSQLSSKNKELETTAKALRVSVLSGEHHHEILNELMRFSLKIQHEKNIEKVGQLTIKLLFLIVESPVGLVLYRNKSSAGFSSYDKSPSAFQAYAASRESIKLSLEDIEQIADQNIGFQLEPIKIDNQLRGYLIYRSSGVLGFTLRALNMLVMILRSYIYQQDLTYKLESQANTDALTGLANRHYFDEKFTELSRKFLSDNQYRKHFAVIVIDINGLKIVNDTLGHAAGDLLIKAVAEILAGLFRESDIISRVGGDEFVVMLSDVTTKQCQHWLFEIQEAAAKKTVTYNDETISISFSCGFSCSDQTPPEQLISVADKNMYAEKSKHNKN